LIANLQRQARDAAPPNQSNGCGWREEDSIQVFTRENLRISAHEEQSVTNVKPFAPNTTQRSAITV
jgi:hypothetical protein